MKNWKIKSILFLIVFFGFFGVAKSSEASILYVSDNGSGTSCATASPCALSYALETKCVAGDTIVLNPGTYSGGMTFSNSTKHDNLTITTTDAVKSALGTFKRGFPSGTDNRPYFPGGGAEIKNGVSGVTIEYMRFRGSASPVNSFCHVVGIYESNTTIRYTKIWNGCSAVYNYATGPITISQCDLSDSGTLGGYGDTHMVGFCRTPGACGGTGDGVATSWTQRILVEETTFSGTANGDYMQFSTGDDSTQYEAYIEIKNCDFLGTPDEQSIDSKGARYVKIHGCNFLGDSGGEGSAYSTIDTVYDSGAAQNYNHYWWIWDNTFRSSGAASGGTHATIWNGGPSDDNWWFWNNVIYNNATGDYGGGGTWYLFGGGGSPSNYYFVHNTVIGNNFLTADQIGGFNCASSNAHVKNNLFYNNANNSGDHGNISTRDGNNCDATHNFVYPTTCPSGWCTAGSNYQTSSAVQVVGAGSGNFNLLESSVCRDHGTLLADNGIFTPSLDINGNHRDSTPDLGAFEYGGVVTPPVCPDTFCNGTETYQSCPQDCPAPDTQKPTVTNFTVPATSSSLVIPITSFTATDNTQVTGYIITESATAPAASDQYWQTSPLTTYEVFSNGTKTLYAWAKDAAGNVSTSKTVTVSVNAPTPDADLMAAYNFDENTGSTLTDLSGHNNTGTISGATWNTSGKYGNSLTFNGTSNLVTVNDSNSLDLTNAMTLEAWIYPTALSQWNTILIKEQPGNLSYALYANNDSNLPSSHVYVNSDQRLNGTAQLPLNAWSHLAATFDGNNQRIYLNGAQINSASIIGSITPSSSPLQLGGNQIWGEYFKGKIDDVRIYNQALSQTEIQTDMSTPLTAPGTDTEAPGAPGGLSVR